MAALIRAINERKLAQAQETGVENYWGLCGEPVENALSTTMFKTARL
jgi:hypothetical protein